MPVAVWAPLLGVLSIALGAVATWAATRYAANRQRSGSVDTSEAKDLWDESRAIREELRKQNEGLLLRLAEAERELAKTQRDLAETNMKLMTSHNQSEALRDEVRELRRLLGRTSADVETVSRELHVIKAETPDREEQRNAAEGQ